MNTTNCDYKNAEKSVKLLFFISIYKSPWTSLKTSANNRIEWYEILNIASGQRKLLEIYIYMYLLFCLQKSKVVSDKFLAITGKVYTGKPIIRYRKKKKKRTHPICEDH